jgi:hypothetical protein
MISTMPVDSEPVGDDHLERRFSGLKEAVGNMIELQAHTFAFF